MALLKVIFLLLALVQTTRAYDIPPFTWKALEEAEKHASTAAASLYAKSLRLQQAGKERVFTPETPLEQSCRQDINPITLHSAPSTAVILGFTLLATMTAFLLGWYGGVKQAESSQALQQAEFADQAEIDADELEKAAKLAVTSVTNPSVASADGRQTWSSMPNALSHNDAPVRADCSTPHQWSSPSDSNKDEDSTREEPSHQASPEGLRSSPSDSNKDEDSPREESSHQASPEGLRTNFKTDWECTVAIAFNSAAGSCFVNSKTVKASNHLKIACHLLWMACRIPTPAKTPWTTQKICFHLRYLLQLVSINYGQSQQLQHQV